ncbi:MAG: hypothetical protein Q4A60_09830 [Pasteurellaceae bacterium]|nr:hypothetical protein [Pasteurellaceae bacterium]
MWHNKIKEPNASTRYPALSLVEILIALGLSAFLLMVLVKWQSQFVVSQLYLRERLQLQQHAQQMVAYMQKHIQYLGFVAKSKQGGNDELFRLNGKAYHLMPNCLLFFYDVNRDGCIGRAFGKQGFCQQAGVNRADEVVKEFFGFKFQPPHLLVFARDIKRCRQEACQEWRDYCQQTSYWENATDLVDYQLDNLQFDWLKPEQILRIRLRLRSQKYPDIQYETVAYSKVLNGVEP